MATIADLVSRHFQEKKQRALEAERHAHPLDVGLPFGLHIDGKLTIQTLPFPAGSKMPVLGKNHVIQGMSRATFLDTQLFRVFLHSEDTGKLSYLWLLQNEGGFELRWFTSLVEVYPGSPEEWEFWLNENGRIGLNQFLTKDQVPYDRLWMPEGDKWIESIHYDEIVFPDRYDAAKQQQVEHDCMLYGRALTGQVWPESNPFVELIMASAIKQAEGGMIAIDVGINLTPNVDLKVQY